MQGILPNGGVRRTASESNVASKILSESCVRNSEQNDKIERVDDGRSQDDFSIVTGGGVPAGARVSFGADTVPQVVCVSEKCALTSDLPPEPEEGNVEYKRTLVSASKTRFEHLVTQLKWRLEEGNGIAVYEIGVEDDGRRTGLSDRDLEWSLETLRRMARCLGASCRVSEQREVTPSGPACKPARMRFGRRRRAQADEPDSGNSTETTAVSNSEKNERRRVAEVEIRRVAPALSVGETRLALLGDADAGKSTLIAVLTHGELDNGRGRARLHLFRHRHEIETGRSSSASLEIVGVNEAHETVNYATAYNVAAMFEASRHVLAFVDLAGHPRFVRTTLSGLMSYAPQLTLLVVSASSAVSSVTQDHFQVARGLGLPVVVVVNKLDQWRGGAGLLDKLNSSLLPHGGFFVVDSGDKIAEAVDIVTSSRGEIVAFALSCVTGQNVSLLQTFLNSLPERFATADTSPCNGGEFLVDGVLSISQLGKVLCGTVVRGSLSEGDNVRLGPDANGRFQDCKIVSIQRFGLTCRSATAGQTASLFLGRLELQPRKGHVVLSGALEAQVAREFEARVRLFEQGALREKMEVTVHCRNVTQTCTVMRVTEGDGEQCVLLRLLKQPELLREGNSVVFRGSRARGVGIVVRLMPFDAAASDSFRRVTAGTKSKSFCETVLPSASSTSASNGNGFAPCHMKLTETRCGIATQKHERGQRRLTESHCHA